MRTHHVFSRVHEDAKRKRLRSQTKEVIVNVYDYFKEVSRCQQTQGPLKRLMTKELHVPVSRVIQHTRGYGNAFSVFLF